MLVRLVMPTVQAPREDPGLDWKARILWKSHNLRPGTLPPHVQPPPLSGWGGDRRPWGGAGHGVGEGKWIPCLSLS